MDADPRLRGSIFHAETQLDLLIFLGRMDVVVVQSNPEVIRGRDMETDPSLLEAGAQIAVGWPSSFHDLCDGLRATYGQAAWTKAYGYLHRFVRRNGDAPFAPLLRKAYAAELARRDMPESRWPEFLPRPDGDTLLLPATKVWRILGMDQKAFRTALEAATTVPLRPAAVVGKQQFYRPSEVMAFGEAIGRKRNSRLGVKKDARALEAFLGVRMRHIRNLLSAGLLEPAPGARRNLLTQGGDLAGKLASVALAGTPPLPVNITETLRMAMRHRPVQLAHIVQAILSGRLRAWSVPGGGSGIAALVFARDETELLLASLKTELEAGRVRGGEFERRAHIPKGSVNLLMNAGLLPPRKWTSSYLFQPFEVDAFTAEFVSDNELAKAGQTTKPRVRDELEKQGVKPLAVFEATHRMPFAVYVRAEVAGCPGWRKAGINRQKTP